jgi:oligoribonuclease
MKKLLWLDMEMSGLDVERERILEVAAIVTDLDFREIEDYHAVVRQPRETLERMDDWNRKHHGASGLTEQVLASGRDQEEVERELVALVRRRIGEPAVLAGNSIGQDRLFINKYMPEFAKSLHYRMLDVTAWKVIMNAKFGVKYEKKNAHRAVDDIRESIAELQLYLAQVKPSA